nr:hypothetical protein [Tanacetum cinerariifolium]
VFIFTGTRLREVDNGHRTFSVNACNLLKAMDKFAAIILQPAKTKVKDGENHNGPVFVAGENGLAGS